MRFEGQLKSWTDDRGFGFIEPDQGGQEIFVHIKSFPPGSGRPKLAQRLSFEVALNPQGKKRAENVRLVRATLRRTPMRRDTPAQWGTASYFAIPAFAAIYLGLAVAWGVPRQIAALYLGASVVCFLAYAFDKSAARSGGWRTSESTLLLLGLVCGWPGAILAQQLLRHKSNKASFRSAFWGSVVMNISALIVFSWMWASRSMA
jgi:uncharacterized membrane protein YsdA (DUF1294 family)/cold shock CspA family protein